MSWESEKVLAVVPARGGSKGIPRKNLRKIAGLSLIARAARVIGALPWIDRAVISTDDADMAEEGRRYGLDVPFMRPAALAGDTSSGPDVLHHAWTEGEKHYGMQFDYALYLEPTSPLRRAEDVEATFKHLLSGPYQSAATVSRSPGHFTPHKCLLVDERGLIRFYLPARPRGPCAPADSGLLLPQRRGLRGAPRAVSDHQGGHRRHHGGRGDRPAAGQCRRRAGARIRRLAVATRGLGRAKEVKQCRVLSPFSSADCSSRERACCGPCSASIRTLRPGSRPIGSTSIGTTSPARIAASACAGLPCSMTEIRPSLNRWPRTAPTSALFSPPCSTRTRRGRARRGGPRRRRAISSTPGGCSSSGRMPR